MTDGSGGEWPSERQEGDASESADEPGEDTSENADPGAEDWEGGDAVSDQRGSSGHTGEGDGNVEQAPADNSTDVQPRDDPTDVQPGDDSTDVQPRDDPTDAPNVVDPEAVSTGAESADVPLADEPGPAVVLEYTTDRRSLTPTVQIQWAIRVLIAVVVLSSIAGFVISTFGLDPLYSSAVLLGLLVLGASWVVLAYRRWIYQVREDALYLERGVLTHVRTLVPYVRIQHVDTSQSPVERALGLSTLVVYTAGSRGADVSIPGLRPDEARTLQRRVKELAIEAEGGDAL